MQVILEALEDQRAAQLGAKGPDLRFGKPMTGDDVIVRILRLMGAGILDQLTVKAES